MCLGGNLGIWRWRKPIDLLVCRKILKSKNIKLLVRVSLLDIHLGIHHTYFRDVDTEIQDLLCFFFFPGFLLHFGSYFNCAPWSRNDRFPSMHSLKIEKILIRSIHLPSSVKCSKGYAHGSPLILLKHSTFQPHFRRSDFASKTQAHRLPNPPKYFNVLLLWTTGKVRAKENTCKWVSMSCVLWIDKVRVK